MPESVRRSYWLWPGAYGAAVFTGTHLALVTYGRSLLGPGDEHAVWWLDSPQGVLLTESALLISAVLAALRGSSAPWRTAVAMIGGVMASATVILFALGPGTVFPIVLAISLFLVSMAVLAGTGLVELPRAMWRRSSPGRV